MSVPGKKFKDVLQIIEMAENEYRRRERQRKSHPPPKVLLSMVSGALTEQKFLWRQVSGSLSDHHHHRHHRHHHHRHHFFMMARGVSIVPL
jgi:hypothetical protein